jgi:hypothetical protein
VPTAKSGPSADRSAARAPLPAINDMASRNSSKNSCDSRFCGGLLRTSLAKLPSMVTLICVSETPWLKTVLSYLRRPVAGQPASARRARGSIEVLRLPPRRPRSDPRARSSRDRRVSNAKAAPRNSKGRRCHHLRLGRRADRRGPQPKIHLLESSAPRVQIPETQPPIPTLARRGRLKWTVPASRTQ